MKILTQKILILLAFSLVYASCTHEPILFDDDFIPIDTIVIDPTDTMEVDTSTNNPTPCDPDVVYFDKEILPMLQSNCAFSGCHDALTAEDGVILESYETVIATADVEPYNLDDSELFEVLIDTREDERMPPAPRNRLPNDQIQLIATWILQGAKQLDCDENPNGCDTENVSFSGFVQPTIQTHCQGCHSGSAPSGGIDLSNYASIKTNALNGKLYGAIHWESGYTPMPFGLDKLPACTIDKIKAWIDDGAQNN